jgi:hypothetical protein
VRQLAHIDLQAPEVRNFDLRKLLLTGDTTLQLGYSFGVRWRQGVARPKKTAAPVRIRRDREPTVNQRKAMVAAIAALGAIVVSVIAVGLDLAVVSSGPSANDAVSAAPATTRAARTTEWARLHTLAPGGADDFSVMRPLGHIHRGVG